MASVAFPSIPGASWRRRAALLLGWLLLLGAATVRADEPPASAAEQQVRARIAQALSRARDAVVGIESVAVEGAGSAATLGPRRRGSGVVIGSDGLVLTIGYLILEAERVDLLFDRERRVPARVVAYDLATGFGLLQALTPLATEPAPLGNAAETALDEPLLIASGGPDGALSIGRILSRRPFSGYWEYHIDGALFTAPARPDHSGAALFNAEGELLGIGSLLLSDALGKGAAPIPGNMFVPVDLLKPILDEMRVAGTSRASSRAWLGLNCVEYEGRLRVVRLTTAGPAEEGGIRPGDQIVRIDGVEVNDLQSFYKTLWQRSPEREVTLDVRRGGVVETLRLHSVDRLKTLRRPLGV